MENNSETPLISNKQNLLQISKKKPPFFHYIILLTFYVIFITILYGMTKLYIFNNNNNSFFHIIISIIFYFTSLMTIICHSKSMFIDNSIDYQNINNNNLNNHCGKCDFNRPQRAHHCKICGVCNLKMDHHCPFILNCVGEKNEKYFNLFLIYSFLSCLISSIFTFKFFILGLNQNKNLIYTKTFHGNLLRILLRNYNNSLSVFTFCFSLLFGLCVFVVFYVNFNHVKIGLTSIEMELYYNNLKNCPYYNDNWKENLFKIFGNEPFKMFLPCEKTFNQNNFLEYDYIALK